jgi:putative restriction endonuclease
VLDSQVRTAAFNFLDEQTALLGDVLPYELLRRGFTFRGERVPLISPQGIFKPRILPDLPLSFNTAPPKPGKVPPYEDELGPDGLIRYRYRGTDPNHRDNRGMALAMDRGVPLIYLFGTVPGKYLAIRPVFVVGADPATLTFTVAVDDKRIVGPAGTTAEEELRRTYVTRVVWQRMHQEAFRDRVLRAYKESCSVCRLRHAELLDAAHILPDGHPEGKPIVPNGVALCKLHHAAYDRHILGIRPDYVVEIRRDILDEIDGPMLQHGLKEMAGTKLHVPGSAGLKPRRDFLEERYELFRKAG